MGFPSICSYVLVPKPLIALVLLLDRIKLLLSAPFIFLGIHFPDGLHPLLPSFWSPVSDGSDVHAYRLSAADLPAPPLPAPASIKRRLRVVQFGKHAAVSSTGCGGAVVEEEEGEEEGMEQEREQEPVCAVCLCGLVAADEVRELGNCRHAFHRGCIDGWVDQGRLTCPLCRARLLPRRRQRGESWVAESISYLLGEELRGGGRRS